MVPLPFIDIEASGFGSRSYPIEVGCVLADGSSYCTLIRPEPDWVHWDDSAEQVHGIRRELLFEHGRQTAEVAATLNQHLMGQVVYTDSWYHDFMWVSRLFDAAEMVPRFTLQDLRAVLDQSEADRWEGAKRDVVEELKLSRHRASNDARILQSTLLRVAGG
jgi:hypothetical protein